MSALAGALKVTILAHEQITEIVHILGSADCIRGSLDRFVAYLKHVKETYGETIIALGETSLSTELESYAQKCYQTCRSIYDIVVKLRTSKFAYGRALVEKGNLRLLENQLANEKADLDRFLQVIRYDFGRTRLSQVVLQINTDFLYIAISTIDWETEVRQLQ